MWTKLGQILKPQPSIYWLNTWAGASCAIKTEESQNIFTIYVTGKDDKNRSRIGKFNLNLESLSISDLSENPIIGLGRKGTLDENGTSYPHVIKIKNKFYLFYLGWIQGLQVPWYNGMFLAESEDGVNFQRVSEAPIFDRNHLDPLGVGSMFVMNDSNVLRMWYARFEKWGETSDEHKHYYNIREASSNSISSWTPKEQIVINHIAPELDYAIAKPSVLKYKNKYFMWYSFRGEEYRIGVAVSNDGQTWERRDDHVGIDVSESGWDSEMICYAHIFRNGEDLYMLYNGNNYGAGGLGIAKSHISLLEKI